MSKCQNFLASRLNKRQAEGQDGTDRFDKKEEGDMMSLRILLVFTVLMSGFSVQAKRGQSLDQVNQVLSQPAIEQEVQRLQKRLRRMNQRLVAVEEFLDQMNGYPPAPPMEHESVCMMVDSGYKKVFIGKGKSQLDAEFEANQLCAKSTHPTYCGSQALLKCDSTSDSPNVSGYVCVVQDSGYKKYFRAEGKTKVEAEALAKQACQKATHPTYCGKETPRCEAMY